MLYGLMPYIECLSTDHGHIYEPTH